MTRTETSSAEQDRTDRLEYLVLQHYRDGEISEGLAMWAIGVDRLTVRGMKRTLTDLETDDYVRELLKESGPGEWRDEAVRRYVAARNEAKL